MGSFALWHCVFSVLLSFWEWQRLKTRLNLFSCSSCLDWSILRKKMTKVSAELMLVKTLYFLISSWLPKLGETLGKDRLPGKGGTGCYWQKFFQCWPAVPAPNSCWTHQKISEGYSSFVCVVLPSWCHTLCLLVLPTWLIQGSYSRRWHLGMGGEGWSWFVLMDSNNECH